jgi:multidrug efflux pump subunit AcrA (membrane-fusion protein)
MTRMNNWILGFALIGLAGLAAAAGSQAAGSAVSAATPASLGCLIEPDKVADLGSAVIGVLDNLRAERGDMVRKGQVLAVLRNDVERATAEVARTRATTEADLRSAEASRDLARQKMRRAEDLVAKNFVAQQALDQARTDFQMAEQKGSTDPRTTEGVESRGGRGGGPGGLADDSQPVRWRGGGTLSFLGRAG